jgi:hypothetical protein
MRYLRHVTCMGEMTDACSILVGKLKGKGPLWGPKHRIGDTITVDLKVIACEGVDWIHLAQNRDHWWAAVNTVMNCLVFHG